MNHTFIWIVDWIREHHAFDIQDYLSSACRYFNKQGGIIETIFHYIFYITVY